MESRSAVWKADGLHFEFLEKPDYLTHLPPLLTDSRLGGAEDTPPAPIPAKEEKRGRKLHGTLESLKKVLGCFGDLLMVVS